MNLKDFKIVTKAFREIELDSRGTYARELWINNPVPSRWVEDFKVVESTLRKVYGKKLRDIPLSNRAWRILKDNVAAKPTDSAFLTVVLPCDSNDRLVLRAAGATAKEARTAAKVMNEFFDGALSGEFMEQDDPRG